MGPATPLAEELKDRFTVYTYDRRGRGESGDTKPYSTQREVEDLQAVIDAAGGSVDDLRHLVRRRRGARDGQPDSGHHQLVLYEVPIFTDTTRKPVPPDYVQRMDPLVASGDNAGAVKHFMQNGINVPWFALLMMQVMGMFKKMAPVGSTPAL